VDCLKTASLSGVERPEAPKMEPDIFLVDSSFRNFLRVSSIAGCPRSPEFRDLGYDSRRWERANFDFAYRQTTNVAGPLRHPSRYERPCRK
jgi:hypothetical protein